MIFQAWADLHPDPLIQARDHFLDVRVPPTKPMSRVRADVLEMVRGLAARFPEYGVEGEVRIAMGRANALVRVVQALVHRGENLFDVDGLAKKTINIRQQVRHLRVVRGRVFPHDVVLQRSDVYRAHRATSWVRRSTASSITSASRTCRLRLMTEKVTRWSG